MLTALDDIDTTYSLGLYLTQGYDTVRAQWDGDLGAHAAGETFTIPVCIDVPADAPRGPYHLRMIVDDRHTGQRLPLYETGTGETALYWGDVMVMAVVAVDTVD